MPAIPVVLFGKEYWDRIISFEAMAEAGTINEADLQLELPDFWFRRAPIRSMSSPSCSPPRT
jgi:hypothetical protein